MAEYKLTIDGGAIKGDVSFPADPANRHYQEYLAWVALGNTPDPAEQPTAEQVAKDIEVNQAGPTARQYFAAHPAAIAFIRLTPAEQEAQIDGMTLAQLKAVVRYLTIAVAALVKREYL